MTSLKIFSSFWLLIIVISSVFTLSLQKDEESGGDVNSWCQTTPHPNQCKYFLGRGQHHAPRHRADFRMMALQAAIDNANEAQGCAKDLGKMCQTTATKAVWNDCYKLLNNTVFQLNQTLTGLKNNQSSDFDAQTWLSAALTNLQTCFMGCVDLNVTDFVAPIKSSNLTEMISNSLAINHGFLKQNVQTNDFPTWVTHLDRRLLATVSIQSIANVTVSKAEGSTFPTIQSALDYLEVSISTSESKNWVDGSGFIARGITFRNTAGPEGAQAVALRSSSDLSVFYALSIDVFPKLWFILSWVTIENRVNWLGYHNNMSLIEAQDFTVGGLIAGRMWLPAPVRSLRNDKDPPKFF
ncbi:probable pectinesterase/pectinesterase inhibitor 60 [Tanacetum coccineum]